MRNHAADRPDQHVFINLSLFICPFALGNLASKAHQMGSIQTNQSRKNSESQKRDPCDTGARTVTSSLSSTSRRSVTNSWIKTSHSRNVTSAVIDARDFLRARAENRRHALIPEGTPVVFAGGRQTFASTEDAKRYAENIWATLDKVRDVVPDLFLVHGGDGKGADRLAASWAERREVQQLTYSLDRRLGARAGFKRNEQMLSLNPRYVVAFPGNGVTERLVIDAKARRITVVDRRGLLGTSPGS